MQQRSEQSKPQRPKHGPPRRRIPATSHALKRMPTAAYPQKSRGNDSYQPTTHRPHQHQLRNWSGFGDPSSRNPPQKLEGVQHHHREPPHPRAITLTGAYHGEGCAIERCMQKGKTENMTISVAVEWGTSHRPQCAPKRAHPSNNWTFRKRKTRTKGPQTQRTRGPPKKGATRRARASDLHHARVKALDETGQDATNLGPL